MKNKLTAMLQFANSTFPSGGFSQSWGLETYVTLGKIKNKLQVQEFIDTYLDGVIGKGEGPIVVWGMKLAKDLLVLDQGAKEKNLEEIVKLEQLSVAIKATKESRENSIKMGKAFLRIARQVVKSKELDGVLEKLKVTNISYPVAYGIVSGVLEIEIEDALLGYTFNSVNGIVQSAIKLVPLGNTEGQEILFEERRNIEEAVRKALTTDIEDISNFTPGFDVASILHENLRVRLYMS